MMSDTLCILPFIHFNIMPSGQATVCCVSQEPLRDATGIPLNIRTHSLHQIWSSPALHDVRSQMLQGVRPKHCETCYRHEDESGTSHRVMQNGFFLVEKTKEIKLTNAPVQFAKTSREQLRADMPKPTYFDLRFDNLCNLKCVICAPSFSSRIENDPVHIAWTPDRAIQRVPNRFGNATKWVRSELLFEELKDIGSDVKFIQLAGGEPFLSELALRWLAHLGETGRAQFVSLRVFTNLTNFNERIIKLLEPFPFVEMMLSIDAARETYEYVRYPGRWSVVHANMQSLAKERKSRLQQASVKVSATMSAFSAARVLEIFEVARDLGFEGILNNAGGPGHVATKYLPTRTKDRIERQLRSFADIHRRQFPNLEDTIDLWMPELKSVDIADRSHRAAVRNVMRFANDMDASRGLDFKALQPDVVADYIAEFGEWCTERRFTGVRSYRRRIVSARKALRDAIQVLPDPFKL